MKHVLHTLSGFFMAFSFLLVLFCMAGADGDCYLICMQSLIVFYLVTFFWYLVYTLTSSEND